MTTSDITLNHSTCGHEVAWYWTDSTDKIISPYINDADVAERWGKLYREAVESGMVRVNGVTYNSKK